jgi:hypothetical protein
VFGFSDFRRKNLEDDWPDFEKKLTSTMTTYSAHVCRYKPRYIIEVTFTAPVPGNEPRTFCFRQFSRFSSAELRIGA